ncbi:hypothetical protein NDU88_007585 [Pleurodeles waltl]|uniref:Carboxylesterase type B domain-containing protein n=1 Tax=Pleurodeles waltl TaxID=8319 RepID=A0AAV7MFL0_PLEWA|nr:hypothetical protein NDU88_007585 [Pleurodeles waltl]
MVNAYLGVPFAKAPVGLRRFARPEPAEAWSDVRTATSYPPLTASTSTEQQEKKTEKLLPHRVMCKA